jgi:hypothetical protein
MMKQENTELDIALKLAAEEPANRPDFYKTLLESTIYVIGESNGLSGEKTIHAGENISILNWEKNDGTPVIAFFSSLDALKTAINEQVSFLRLPTKSLFEITLGTTLVLNPTSAYSKEFHPSEIEMLLSDGVNRLPIQRVVKQDTNVLLGQPANYPSQLIDSLTTFFSKRPNVVSAYLALMHDQSTDEKPHLIIGIHSEGDFEQIIRDAGVVAGDASPDGESVDMFHIIPDCNEGLSEYFLKEVKPFYMRSWGLKLKSILGFGKA